ncbi:hypothetical protein FB387_002615 [Streptomyces cinereoruber]|nr:hypothetical protein [Streptomyces cinereoruber]NIH61486.1 hypothetical protein [Streptomyces cinereoruber]
MASAQGSGARNLTSPTPVKDAAAGPPAVSASYAGV